MQPVRFSVSPKGNFIGGSFLRPRDSVGEWLAKSPADYKDIFGKVAFSYSDVDRAIESAHAAFHSWRRVPFLDRANHLKKFQERLKTRHHELCEILARETGKPLWEAKTEIDAMVAKVDISISEGMQQIHDIEIPEIQKGTMGRCCFKPLGVVAVIGPFNFPGHLPNGHIVPALACGNTVVFKPSEKTPMVGQLIAECFSEAGFPAGVFNMLQGEKEVGRRLCVHEGVKGVLFTGSYEVGTRIKQDTLQQHWKLLALEMGGKNPAIIWEDAHLDSAVLETLVGAFITAGQRCSATSRILVHKRILGAFTELFHQRAKSFSIGHPLDEPFMGPLIEQGAVDRYMKFLGIAAREGCEILMRGKKLVLEKEGNYVTPSICKVKDSSLSGVEKSVYLQTELFAPNAAIIEVGDLDHAIALANATQYGLVASVFTRSRETYERILEGLEFGLVNWNKSTTGASSRLPFGGTKKSGNHFPTALFAGRYCTYPVSSLETEQTQINSASFPGLNWA